MKPLLHAVILLVLMGLVAAGCEVPLAPEALPDTARDGVSAVAKGGPAACPIDADVVVTDETGLLAALGAASPGDVIGVDGMIEITVDVLLATEDLTLTCATSGSGFFTHQPLTGNFDLLTALARGVTVDRLVLDASSSLTDRIPYFAWNDGAAYTAEDVRFSNNTVICGSKICAFFAGVKGAVISGNSFVSAGSQSGVHIQGGGDLGPDGSSPRPTDGTRVERNTFVATTPQPGCMLCGGIRVRDGRDVEVSHNIVRGPWLNSMSLTNLRESQIEKNRVEGAVHFGIATSFNSGIPEGIVLVRDNVFRNNRVTDVGSADATPPLGLPPAGVLMRRACGNTLFGNNLQGNQDDLGAIFTEESGANTLAGNKNVVIDNGHFDCDGDGDGVVDPNVITGTGQVLGNVNLGQIVSEAGSSSAGKGPPLQ